MSYFSPKALNRLFSDEAWDEARLITKTGKYYFSSSYSGDTVTVTIGEEDYTLEVIEVRDGDEGDFTLETYFIFEIDGRRFRKTGIYKSHYGTDWDGPVREVKKVEKTITVWEVV